MLKAREHHYKFAHKVLPAIFYHNPAGFIELLANEGKGFLYAIWNRIAEDIKLSEQVSFEGLNCELRTLENNLSVALIILPPPQRIPEAYFLALVHGPKDEAHQTAITRYITLEYSFNLDGSTRTVLGEWLRKGHQNMGDGPEADLDAFFEEVKKMVG